MQLHFQIAQRPNMRSLFLCSFFLVSSVAGQSPQEIVAEYRIKALTACERLDSTLRREGAVIAAKMVSEGNTIGAAEVSRQINAKIAGDPISQAHNSLRTLFLQYDTARQTTLRPIQAASIQRLDNLLNGSANRDMAKILQIAKVREEIEGGKIITPEQSADAEQSENPRKMHLEWDYFSHADMLVTAGHLVLNEDQSLVLYGLPGSGAVTKGIWRPTDNPRVIEVELIGKNEGLGTITFKGKTAEYRRSIGLRYLRAK